VRQTWIGKKPRKVTKLFPGTYWVAVNHDSSRTGYGTAPHPKKVTVKAGTTTKVTLRLQKGRTVSGKVTFKGKPVKGLRVQVFDPKGVANPHGSASTDAKGRFTLKHAPTKATHLQVSDPWGVYRRTTATFKASGKVTGLRVKVTK